jgi:hypothetical protein
MHARDWGVAKVFPSFVREDSGGVTLQGSYFRDRAWHRCLREGGKKSEASGQGGAGFGMARRRAEREVSIEAG